MTNNLQKKVNCNSDWADFSSFGFIIVNCILHSNYVLVDPKKIYLKKRMGDVIVGANSKIPVLYWTKYLMFDNWLQVNNFDANLPVRDI